ncbi:MAG: carboxypeptidase [Streptosporangiales bacterium]|nr:carboxypeptidase [Streptosporangiales bacterium]
MSTSSHRRVRAPDDTRSGRRAASGEKRRRPWYVPTFRRVLWVFGLGLLAGGALVGVGYAVTPIPAAHDVAVSEATMVYYGNGKPIGKLAEENRVAVPLNKVPKHVQMAVLAAENRDFYTEPGVSPRGLARAIWGVATGGYAGGGSTITQQYSKVAFLSPEQTISRKLKEMFIAIKLDRQRSKDWILEQYLNTIYFGRGAYGIQAAADAYFHKPVGKLTPSQGAMLASLIQLPEYYSLPENRGELVQRWRYVIDGMVKMGQVSPEQVARMRPAEFRKERADNAFAGQRGYLMRRTITELQQLGFSEDMIYRRGLRVHTTFDPRLQMYARQAVEEARPEDWPAKVQTGLVAVEPRTGEVLAEYGGRNYLKHQYDNAFMAAPQAGSAFKPYVLAAALEDGIGLDSMVDGSSPQTFKGGYRVSNDGNVNYGPITLTRATQKSVNTAYVNLAMKVGLSKVMETAEEAGIPAETLEPHAGRAGMALGIASVRPVEQAAGFATFASGGMYAEPHVVRRVEDSDGNLQKQVTPQTHRAFSADVAADTTYAMQQVVRGGTATAARLSDRPAAGKTGTTDKNKAAWFVGFTPQISTAVAMFHQDGKSLIGLPGYSEIYGGTVPASIWNAFMERAMANKPVEQFPQRADVGITQLYATPTPTATPTPSVTATPKPTIPGPEWSEEPWPGYSEEPEEPEEDPGFPFGTDDEPTEESNTVPRRSDE